MTITAGPIADGAIADGGASGSEANLIVTVPGVTLAATATVEIAATAALTLPGLGVTAKAVNIGKVWAGDCGWIGASGQALYTLLGHLPLGAAWLAWRIVGKTAYKLMTALAAVYDTMTEAMCKLTAEIDPRTTSELLPEWEAAVGLPDACLPTATQDYERRRLIMLRLSKRRWTTAQDWIDLAALFGISITITPGWRVQKPALYAACYPKRYDLFPKLGRFRVYIDITNVAFTGYTYGADADAATGYAITYGTTDPRLIALYCIFDRIRPANVVIIWNENPRALPCVD